MLIKDKRYLLPIIVVIGVSVLSYNTVINKRHKLLEDISLSLGEVVSKHYRGEDLLKNITEDAKKYISSNALKDIGLHNTHLKDKENEKLNVSKYYKDKILAFREKEESDGYNEELFSDETYFSGLPLETQEAINNGTLTIEGLKGDSQLDLYENDSRIFNEKGVDYVYLRDLTYDENNSCPIQYKDAILYISKDEVGSIYSEIIKDVSNRFRLDSYDTIKENNEWCTKIVYKSPIKSKVLSVSVYNDGKKINKVKVEGGV